MAKHVAILGGGISGLAAAWYLKKRHPQLKITLLEKRSRVGGWIHTFERSGFQFEQGPRSCRPRGAGVTTLQLIQELGLQDHVVPGDLAAHQRYLYINKRLRIVPQGLLTLLQSPWIWPALAPVLTEWFQPQGQQEDESIYAFMSRRFSPRFAELLADPLAKGIYAGDIRQLSMSSCFPLWDQWEKQAGSVIKGAFSSPKKKETDPFIRTVQRSSLFSLKGGMETLVKALATQLQNEIQCQAEVAALRWMPFGVDVMLSNGDSLTVDHVISALPAYTLAPLVNDDSLTMLLNQIPHASLALVHVGFRSPVLKQKGFGYLVPSSERESVLGCIWDSSAFPHLSQSEQETRLTVMLGGAAGPELHDYPHFPWIEKAQEALSRHMDIKIPPDYMECTFAPKAVPQYVVGHQKRLNAIEHRLHSLTPHMTLLGSSFYGVSVNDCIAHAEKAIKQLQLGIEKREEVYAIPDGVPYYED